MLSHTVPRRARNGQPRAPHHAEVGGRAARPVRHPRHRRRHRRWSGRPSRRPPATDALPTGTDSRQAARAARPAARGRGLGGRRALQQRPAAHPGRARRRRGARRALPGAGRCTRRARPRTAPPRLAVVPVDDRRTPRRRPSVVARPPHDASRPTCPTGVTAQVTGPAAIQADLAAVFDGANTRLLAATASVVALLLVLTYRSPILWLVPLTVVGVADRLAAVLATHTLAAFGVALGRVDDRHPLGARLRRRHRLRAAADLALPRRAAQPPRPRARRWRVALRRTAEAVLSSATTVVLGLLTLLLSLFPATRGLGARLRRRRRRRRGLRPVVLPAALVVFGRWIFWPKVPRVGEAGLADGHSLWRRVGDARRRAPAALRHRHGRPARRHGGRHRRDRDRARPGRPVPRRSPRPSPPSERLAAVLPRRQPPTRPTCMTRGDGDGRRAPTEGGRRASPVRVAASGNGVTEVDAVIDAAARARTPRPTPCAALRDAVAGTARHATSAGTEAVALDAGGGLAAATGW